mgnify:CR=1 FL=1
MLMLFRRMVAVIRLSRAGRGEELDRIAQAMDEGARFKGAHGEMLLILANDSGYSEACMRRNERRFISDSALGELYARKLKQRIMDARHEPLLQEDLSS